MQSQWALYWCDNNNDYMRKLSLTFPDQIIEELSLLCLNKPKVCKKQSKLGWTSNDRILNVQGNFIQYYNLHPGFVEQDPHSLKRKHFKAAVRLDFIHEVNFLPKNKIKKTYLEVIFPQKKMIVKASDQSRVENEEEEDAKGTEEEKMEKWLFEFPFDIKEFIQSKRQEEKEQKRTLAKIIPLSPRELKELINFNLPPRAAEQPTPTSQKTQQPMPTFVTPRRSNDDHHELNIEDYVESIQRTKNLLKTKAEMAQEQKVRQRKKKEKELAEIVSTKNQNVQESFSISSFWRQYYKLYEVVIKGDLKGHRTEKIQKEIGLLREIQFFNSAAKRIAQNFVDELVCGFNESGRQFEGWRYYQGVWVKVGGKQLNQQFMVNYNINDILFTLRQVRGYKLRLPLMSLIEYKGVKLLIMCDMPFSELEKTEVYNLMSAEGDLQLMGRLKEAVDVIEDVLNVKSEPFQVEPKRKVLAPLGPSLKIFQYNFKKDKTQDQITLPNFYYLINPGIIFPIDYNFQKSTLNEMARLRPEIVAFFRDYTKDENCQLLSQAFMVSSATQEFKRTQDNKVRQASRLIETYWIPLLLDRLDNVELMLVDSYSFKTILQQMGINVRYLHRIYEQTSLPYIRQTVLVEALSRTIKKQYRQALADLAEDNSVERSGFKRNTKQYMTVMGEKKEEGQQKYRSFALDYLNLVFGQGEESQQFWKIILYKCSEYFKITSSYPPPVKPGCLLNAVLWHCGINVHFDASVPLFKSQAPFHEETEVEFQMRIKTFDFPSFEIQKLFRSAPSLEEKIEFQLFKQVNPRLLKMELMFARTIGWQLNTVLSKLSNFQEFLQKPKLKNALHPMLLPYYISNKSTYNFNCGMEILNFSLPDTHPLFVSFHLEYASLFDDELMRKSALLLAVKCFGEFHLKTTQLYSRFYHEGYEEYYVKAQRLKNIEACSIICAEFYQEKKFESCLAYCLDQITKMNDRNGQQKLGTGNYHTYLHMLMQGLDSALRIVELDKGIIISKQISEIASSFKYSDSAFTQELFRNTLLIHLLKSNKKYFLYKMVMFVVYIRGKHETVVCDAEGLAVPCSGAEKDKILLGMASEYFEHGNHSNWLAFILATIVKSFQYFNFLEDLFNSYAEHLRRYNSEEFKNCLGYLDLLVRLYGQKLFKQTLYDVRFN